MTSCDYCERSEPRDRIVLCDSCGAAVCSFSHAVTDGCAIFCAPPKGGPHQQRGCYKPPVAEVTGE